MNKCTECNQETDELEDGICWECLLAEQGLFIIPVTATQEWKLYQERLH